MRMSGSVLAILSTVLAAVPRVHAQVPHAAPPSAIEAALQQHVANAAADRADVLRVLDRADVKAVAGRAGIDVRRAASAVATIDGQELTEIAAQARLVDQSLAGGQSKVVISTTTIIIGLLVLILIIVAVD